MLKNIIKIPFEYFKNLRIREKILLSFIIVFIPIIIITFLTYNRSTRIIEEQVIDSTRNSFEQASKFILYKMDNIKDVSSLLYMNKDIQRILAKNGRNYPLSEQIEDYNKLLDIVRSAQNYREIYKIRLFVRNDSIYSNEGSTIINENFVKNSEWYKKVLETGGIYWIPTYNYDYTSGLGQSQKIISCMRTINDADYTGSILGVVSIDILEDSIYEIIKQTNITSYGQIFLTDENGIIISTEDKSRIGTSVAGEKYFTEIKNGSSGYKKVKINNNNSIVCYKTLESTNWYLIAVIPLKEIVFPTRQALSYFALIMMIMIFVSMAFVYYISNGITKRIRQLIKHMKKIEEDNWDICIPVDSRDEIGVLQKNFNKMVENIRMLIKETYEAELKKKSAELKSLQAQINPHFLYNTLDMIRWLALKNRSQDIANIVSSLAKFFKLSLSNGKDIVTIRDEVNHVKTYLEIQNSRFGNSVETIIDIEDEINSLMTVKLILQPIVENAIIHGIQKKDSKKGYVKITGKKKDNIIIITVEDNGIGMSKEKILEILNKSKATGYGIKNVNERIQLYFGYEYGLEFQSEEGKGTKVIIRFPAVSTESIQEKNNDFKGQVPLE